MKSGGISVSSEVWTIFRRFSIIIPAVFVFYVLFLTTAPQFASKFFSVELSSWILLAWTVVSTMVVFAKPTRVQLITFLTIYHLLAALFVILVAGVSAPTTLVWTSLVTMCYVLFSKNGAVLSIMTLILVVIIYRAFEPAADMNVLLDFMFLVAVILVSLNCIYFVWLHQKEQKRLNESRKNEAHQKNSIITLMNNVADAVISVNSQGRVTHYNAAVLGLLDTNTTMADSLIEESLRLQREDESTVSVMELLNKSKSMVIDDNLYIGSGDERIRIEMTYSPIRNSYSDKNTSAKFDDGYVIIFRDVTKAKSLEEERDEFISVVSHELRTPIAITEGAVDNAQLIYHKDPSKTELVSSSLKVAHEQIIFLSGMVNDLSTLSRAERGIADTAEYIDVRELAHALHSEYEPEARKKNLDFDIEAHGSLGYVLASRLYLRELLQNFITNSIKYTENGSVTLMITHLKGNTTFAVKDTGIGISKSDKMKIFQKFYRSEDYRTRETGGTGLGLYVAKKLSKKLGTQIEVTSRLNHGSTFSFTLPEVEKPTGL